MSRILGVVLAGGQARRMGGGDKCLLEICGRSMLERILERAKPQVDHLVINANGDPRRFASFDHAVIPDTVGGFLGPLAGILSAMEFAEKDEDGFEWLASFPGDAPFIPSTLVDELSAAASRDLVQLARAVSNGRQHPVCGLWHVSLATDLRKALVEDGMRKIDLWTAGYSLVEVEFPAEGYDPFLNVNSPDDLDSVRRLFATTVQAL